MKKHWILILFAGIALLLLTACRQTAPTNSQPDSGETQQTTSSSTKIQTSVTGEITGETTDAIEQSTNLPSTAATTSSTGAISNKTISTLPTDTEVATGNTSKTESTPTTTPRVLDADGDGWIDGWY